MCVSVDLKNDASQCPNLYEENSDLDYNERFASFTLYIYPCLTCACTRD